MTNRRTPSTPAVAAARVMAARTRIVLSGVGALLLLSTPSLHPHPLAAGVGLAILAGTALVHSWSLPESWLRVEEVVATSAGVLMVTLGDGGVTVLTLLWLASVAIGVIARGGRVGPAGRVLVLAVLVSPLARTGFTADSLGLLAAGAGLLLVVGRISAETSELLRDPLTDVLSRAAFQAQVARRPASAIVLLDLDDFGRVNKEQGHEAGDGLLVRAARAMSGALREEDVLGRLGR